MQGALVAGHAGGDGVLPDAVARLGYQVGECAQRGELPGRKQIAERGKAVKWRRKPTCILRHRQFRLPAWTRVSRHRLVTFGRRQIHPAWIALRNDRQQPRAHTTSHAFDPDVVRRDRHARHQAAEVGAARQLGAGLGRSRVGRRADLDREAVAVTVRADHRFDVRFLALLGGQHEGGDQRHLHLRERRVGALDRARPQPRDHRQLTPGVGQQIGAFPHHLVGYRDLGIEMADAPLRLLPHPAPIAAHVLRQTARAGPFPAGDQLRLRPRLRVHRRAPGELRRELDHRLVDQHGHRVQVAGVRLQAEPLRFQRQRAAAGERVVERRQALRVEQLGRARMISVVGAGAPPGRADFVTRLLQHLLVGGVLPLEQLFDQLEQPLPLPVLLLLGGEEFRAAGGIVDQLREDDGAGGRQRAPRPPQMQGAGVAVADRLLARRGGVDGVQRQRHLDQLLHWPTIGAPRRKSANDRWLTPAKSAG